MPLRRISSPLGQRVIKKLPVIMQESMAVGNELGQKLGRQVMQRINAPDHGDIGQP